MMPDAGRIHQSDPPNSACACQGGNARITRRPISSFASRRL
jgi:hypothetical protein